MREYDFSEVGLNALEEAYYENYTYSRQLPEIFDLVEDDVLYGYLCNEFNKDFTYEELVEMFGEDD